MRIFFSLFLLHSFLFPFGIEDLAKGCSDDGGKLVVQWHEKCDGEETEGECGAGVALSELELKCSEIPTHECSGYKTDGYYVSSDNLYYCNWVVAREFREVDEELWYFEVSTRTVVYKCLSKYDDGFGTCDTTKRCQDQCCSTCECECPLGFISTGVGGTCGDGSYYKECVPVKPKIKEMGGDLCHNSSGGCAITQEECDEMQGEYNPTDCTCSTPCSADPMDPLEFEPKNPQPFQPENPLECTNLGEVMVGGKCLCDRGYFRDLDGVCKLIDDTIYPDENATGDDGTGDDGTGDDGTGDDGTGDDGTGDDHPLGCIENEIRSNGKCICDPSAGYEKQADGSCMKKSDDSEDENGTRDDESAAVAYIKSQLSTLTISGVSYIAPSEGIMPTATLDMYGHVYNLFPIEKVKQEQWDMFATALYWIATITALFTIFGTI